NSVTDNGAGGLSSSIGEMASETNGAKVFLDQVPLKYSGLLPWQIFISESQERMTLSVPKENWSLLKAFADSRNVQASVVGEFTDSGILQILYGQEEVGSLSLSFLHDGLPKMNLKAKWTGPRARTSWKKAPARRLPLPSASAILEKLVTDPSLASKEKWIRQYDHEVQGATVVKPFESGKSSAPNDGAVIWMGAHGNEGFSGAVISSGICPDYALIDPAIMAKLAVDEAVRNALVTGANPDKIALIDNFCWPDPLPGPKNLDAEQKLSELVRTCRALAEIVLEYEMPLISGKDSMKNDFIGTTSDGREVKISVLPTLLVTALAYHPDVRQALKPHAKPGSVLYVLGRPATTEYFGATLPKYFEIECSSEFRFDLKQTRAFYQRFYEATRAQLISSAHDLSEGGLLFALFESLLLHEGGVSLAMEDNELAYLFGEDPGRILVSIEANQVEAFEAHFDPSERKCLGTVDETRAIRLLRKDGVEELALEPIAHLWRNQV
ncbi:MAG: phosphoribosylformylglycinamidine synthase, partial [Bdellovibrionales bacterium]|nr:phosphoribosylformylglycinamidine synthase [Oligoflexia bacterium]